MPMGVPVDSEVSMISVKIESIHTICTVKPNKFSISSSIVMALSESRSRMPRL